MEIIELINEAASYISSLWVEHMVLVKLAIDVAYGRVDASLLVRVLGSHISKESAIVSKGLLNLKTLSEVKDMYGELSRLYIGGGLGKGDLARFVKLLEKHDSEFRAELTRIVEDIYVKSMEALST